MTIRKIIIEDNAQLEIIIKGVLLELKAPKQGTAFSDLATKSMFENYQAKDAVYFVIEKEGKILGGSGIQPLQVAHSPICELQKMYFLKEIRGKGWGTKLLSHCLEKAKEMGFKACYLETMPQMKAALRLYEKFGFQKISQKDANVKRPLGNTGSHACSIQMLKNF